MLGTIDEIMLRPPLEVMTDLATLYNGRPGEGSSVWSTIPLPVRLAPISSYAYYSSYGGFMDFFDKRLAEKAACYLDIYNNTINTSTGCALTLAAMANYLGETLIHPPAPRGSYPSDYKLSVDLSAKWALQRAKFLRMMIYQRDLITPRVTSRWYAYGSTGNWRQTSPSAAENYAYDQATVRSYSDTFGLFGCFNLYRSNYNSDYDYYYGNYNAINCVDLTRPASVAGSADIKIIMQGEAYSDSLAENCYYDDLGVGVQQGRNILTIESTSEVTTWTLPKPRVTKALTAPSLEGYCVYGYRARYIYFGLEV